MQQQCWPLKFGLYLCASVLQNVLDRLPLVHQLFVEFRGDFLLLDHALAGLQVRHLLLGGQHTGMVSYIRLFFSPILRHQAQQNFRNLEFRREILEFRQNSFHFDGGNLENFLSLDEKS